MKKISFRNDILPLKNELYRLALRITLNPAEAEDVVQETMIKVWNRRDHWEEKAENQNPSLEEGSDAADHSYSSNPEEQAMQRDRIALVRQLIDNLPEKQRSCMQLREFEGKSYKEIAKILSVTEEQVKINIFRARQQIKQQFIKAENYGL